MQTYFIALGDHVKIGKSGDVASRFKSFSTGSPHPLTILLALNGNRERELHQKFHDDHIRGEWFKLSPQIYKFVADCLRLRTIAQDLASIERVINNRKGSCSLFFRWLLQQTTRDDVIGDLARDAKSDVEFPRQAIDYKTLAGYLRWHPHACRKSRAALALAFHEWQRGA